MPRDATGLYTRPLGTIAASGAIITDEAFNDALDDIANEIGKDALISQLRDIAGIATSTGTGAAYAVLAATPMTALANGTLVGFRPHVANIGACTLTVTGGQAGASAQPAAPLRAVSGTDLSAGDLVVNNPVVASYSPTSFVKAITGALTNGSVQLTGVPDTTGLAIGQALSSTTPGIPVGTTIASIAGTTVTMSAAFAGANTPAASVTARGGEWLLVQGALLATSSRLALAGGVSPVALSTATTLAAPHRSKLLLGNGTFPITFSPATTNGAGWFDYLQNVGSGDLTVQATTVGTFTASATQGSNQLTNASATGSLGIGQAISGAIATATITGTLTNGSNQVTTASSITGLYAGQTVVANVPGLPSGTTVVSATGSTITLSANFVGQTTAGVTLKVASGLPSGTTITAVAGTTVTVSAPWNAVTTASTGFTATSDLIDGLPSYLMYPGETRLFVCDGIGYQSLVVTPFDKRIPISGTFRKPPGYLAFEGELNAGGGGGSRSGGTYNGAGGAGGGATPFRIAAALVAATENVVIGAGATGTGGSAGGGGNSSFGTLVTAYAGGGAYADTGGNFANGGGGGGALGAGDTATSSYGGAGPSGGAPSINTTSGRDNPGFGGGTGGSNGGAGGNSGYGGGGGGAGGATGGSSLYGGGGGGGSTGTGGRSLYAGAGGAGGNTASGADGVAPSGGGGGTITGTKGGDGARGELHIKGVI